MWVCMTAALLFGYPVLAEEIVFSTGQSDYYVLVGEESDIPLSIQSDYPDPVRGMLLYSMTQAIQAQGLSSSFTNQQQQSFSINPGSTGTALRVGAQNTPGSMKLDIAYEYTDDSGEKTVILPTITIHVIENPDQAQNQNNTRQSSTTKGHAQQSGSGSTQGITAQDLLSQMQQDMMQQMMTRPQAGSAGNQERQQSAQEALYNNQMNADATALAEQLATEAEKKEDEKQSLEQALKQDLLYQKAVRLLLDTGYSESSATLIPTTNDSGSFSMQYTSQAGVGMQLTGTIKEGEVSSLSIEGTGGLQGSENPGE